MKSNLPSFKVAGNKNSIAVIYAQGEIIYGKGNEDFIGQKLMLKTLKKAANNKKIKAIVLRINSPGGSALTSDLIWNAIEKAKEKKPVVVSMGNVAASGGYYIACNATKIFAEPTSITGSIGVFGIMPNLAPIAKKNGVNSEVVSTHNNHSHYSVVNPISSEFKGNLKEEVEFIYDTFISKVAQGRHMSIASVDSLAQGRVWTGAQAKQNGLVDELGSLKDAIGYAATVAEITDYDITELPEYEMDFKALLSTPFMSVFKNSSSNVTRQSIQKVEQLQSIFEMEGIQARLPFEFTIH